MKTIKTILVAVLWGILIPALAANCSDKKSAEKAESVDATKKTEIVIDVANPPFTKFIVVTAEEAVLYQKADVNSPNLVRWIESDCESDYCENIYQWSDQPAKPGFELSTDIIASEGRTYPVLGEEGDFYKVCTLEEWCDIESAYIPKASVGDIECAPIKAEKLEAEDDYFKCLVVKDGKYKDIVLIEESDELVGETLQVGVLSDGAVGIPAVYNFDCSLDAEQKDDLTINESEGIFFLKYNKNLAMTAAEDEGVYLLDLKKLNDEHIAKIVDTVTSKKSEYVKWMYHFPAQGLETFYYKAK